MGMVLRYGSSTYWLIVLISLTDYAYAGSFAALVIVLKTMR